MTPRRQPPSAPSAPPSAPSAPPSAPSAPRRRPDRPAAPRLLRGVLDLLYPPTCLACEAPTERVGGLCGACWRGATFLTGRVCDSCGAPLAHTPAASSGAATPGREGGERAICEPCATWPPAWDRGRAAARYGGAVRALALALKHADRTEAARPMARWMARAGAPLLAEADLLAPIPLHWTRRAARRFNQSEELARALERLTGVPAAGLLTRTRRTPSQDGKTRGERRANVAGAFRAAASARRRVAGARLVLIDDVMTTGATLSAAAEALRPLRPASIDVLTFARVARRDDGEPAFDPIA